MKILHVITSLNTGGAEKLLVDMAPLYEKKEFQIDVLLFDGTDTPFRRQLEKSGMKIISLGKRFVYNPLFILKLIPYLRSYDIVHTHNTACQYFVAIAKIITPNRVKLVTTEHSTTNRRRNILLFRLLDKFIYAQYNFIISISSAATKSLKKHLNTKLPIRTISNGINIPLFQCAKPLNKNELNLKYTSFIITMVAGFRQEKDQDTLIRAISFLPNEYCLCLVGDGVRRSICEKLAKSLGIEERIRFTGIRVDIPQILKTSDIIVMSSHYEGLSLSSIEGMSVGKPFIASDVNGLREITEGAGILFPHQDEKVLAEIIENLINNDSLYKQIAEQCKKRASEYDIQKTVNAYEEIYKKVICK